MPLEIEYKFLVQKQTWLQSNERKTAKIICIDQGYITTTPHAVVRVRLKDERAFLTIKGAANGPSRLEFEYEIPTDEAQELLEKLCKGRIRKKRYLVSFEEKIWEVDEFEGENAPLVVAEIELERSDEPFSKPNWLGENVTEDHRYTNSELSKNPYSSW